MGAVLDLVQTLVPGLEKIKAIPLADDSFFYYILFSSCGTA